MDRVTSTDDAGIVSPTLASSVSTSSYSGGEDPNWVHDFLLESLCARRVILTIKVDQFNLAPQYVRRFTVTKYHGEDVSMANKVIDADETGTSTILPKHGQDYCDVKGEDEAWLNTITNDEWEMSAKCMWGPCTPIVTPTTSTTSVAGGIHDDSGKSKSEVAGGIHEPDDCDDFGKSNSEVAGGIRERDDCDDSGKSNSEVVGGNHEVDASDDYGKSKSEINNSKHDEEKNEDYDD